ncbi:DNA cytosine methyltransferase [Sulfurovum sp. zt1-1]|uniref:DNA (cytosine-5-)-methyltransferase n=1 Tax=Sulfurovum zhangzhouensis TaxID=3019067 RepID=A0ABT7QZ48_9BACT|nr:DNA cytosine methyltransferase [Sulfurovum zhangzhouensis]MDM5272114.1 DNA cytosine methyltransferase [Sulfurovum zhangzhouensis]
MSKRVLHPRLGVNDEELSVELFAGGGGVSAGGKMIGFKFDIAINHSPSALAIHRANFPKSIQMINDVFEYHPLLVTRGAGVKHLHLSPDCTYHSRAKGKKKVLNRHTICGDHCSVDHTKLSQETADRIRGLAWVGIGWAATVRPRRITLENVSEFKDWGATMVDKDGDIVPDPSRKGETFNAFVGVLTTGIPENHPSFIEIERFLKPFIGKDYSRKQLIKGLGYEVEFKELVASDYGSPTSRKRLYMMARCDGMPIEWPEPTHGDPSAKGFKESGLKTWRTAGECIDWEVPTPSIFKSKQQIKEELNLKVVRPLADNTMKRIANGIKKFVIETDKPYIVKINHKGDQYRGQSIDEPLHTITSKNGYGLAVPYFQSYYGETKGADVRGGTLDRPLHTITSGGQRFGLVVPYITGIDNKSSGDKSVWSADRPLTTIVTEKRHAITAAYVINAKGTDPKRMPIGNSLEEPLTTITASDTHGVIMAHIQHQFGQSVGQKIDMPLNAITAIPKMSVIASHCIKMKGDNLGYGCDEPVHTITAGGLSHGLIASHLYKFYGNDIHGQSCDEPLHTIRTKDCFGVLQEKLMTPPISDDDRYTAWWIARMMEEYADEPVPMIGAIPLPRKRFVQTRSGDIIVDIGMRMFTERELFRAQGFPDDFIYDPEYEVVEKGVTKTKKVTKTEAVRMVGNSVPPHVAKAILWEMEESELIFEKETVA